MKKIFFGVLTALFAISIGMSILYAAPARVKFGKDTGSFCHSLEFSGNDVSMPCMMPAEYETKFQWGWMYKLVLDNDDPHAMRIYTYKFDIVAGNLVAVAAAVMTYGLLTRLLRGRS